MNQTRKTILQGNIEKVFYAGPKFSAGRLRDADGRSRSFAGNLFAVEGQLDCGFRIADCGFDGNGELVSSAIQNRQSAIVSLSAFGLTHHQAGTLIEKLGNNAQAVLEDNPCLSFQKNHSEVRKNRCSSYPSASSPESRIIHRFHPRKSD